VAAVPETIGRLGNLLYLDLRANALTTLPGSIGDLPNLQKLDLRWTPLAEMPPPDSFARLERRGCVVLR
jgi:Leucine-rich repeat (LRR) protein